MSPLEFYSYVLLVGMIAGVLAGLLGIGGGLVIVPALVVLLPGIGVDATVVMHVALGTSLASIVFTSLSSVLAHHRHGAVLWSVVRRMAFAIAIGAFAGAFLADQMDTGVLKHVFAIFIVLVAIQLMMGWMARARASMPNIENQSLAGLVIGIVSSMVGIGGGTMTVPYLMWHGVNIRHAVATAAANGLPIAVAASTGYLIAGFQAVGWQDWRIGYIDLSVLFVLVAGSVCMAPLGAKWAHRVNIRLLKRIFAVVLFVVAVKMFLG